LIGPYGASWAGGSAVYVPIKVRNKVVNRPPSGPDWIHEIKHDGYRLMVRRTASSRVSIRTRRGFDWGSR
jgi:ATP-dependent DNA ligase